MSGLTVERLDGDFSGAELRAIAATLANSEPELVCEVTMVVILHPAAGGHDMRVVTSITGAPVQVAGMLAHAARHVHGGCKPCARAHRKGGSNATA